MSKAIHTYQRAATILKDVRKASEAYREIKGVAQNKGSVHKVAINSARKSGLMSKISH